MSNLLFVKLNNLAKYVYQSGIFLILNFKKIKINPQTLLVIRLDSIGDYVLFMNFLCEIKKSDKYKNYSVTLCGNLLWKNLAETFSNDCVNKFVWVDRNKFHNSLKYKYEFLKKIKERGFEIVIDSTLTREILFGDAIVNASAAQHRIGCTGDLVKNSRVKKKIFSNHYFTQLIHAAEDDQFEFYYNREFFSNLLGKKLDISKPSINFEKYKSNKILKNKYVVIFPGAAELKRCWNIANFISTAKHLLDNFPLDLVLAGSIYDSHLATKIVDNLKSNRVIDYTGRTTLAELVLLISNSKFIITNDTGAAHISAAVNTAFICVSNGKHLLRFNPYPKEVFDKSIYIYPEPIQKYSDDFTRISKNYRFNSELDINSIKPEYVIQKIDSLTSII